MERRRRARTGKLGNFIPWLTPKWETPTHLAPILDVFDRIKLGEVVRVLVSVPPQHGKTETELHGIAQLLAVDPTRTHAFTSYAAQYAESKSRLCRDYALRAGVKLRNDSAAVHEWRTTSGGGLLATGVGGPLTGQGVDGLLVVDDPFKNRQEAESELYRDRVAEWFTSAAMTRAHPSTSVLVVHTRWHPDDLIGRLEQERGFDGLPLWTYINLPAIDDAGQPLWPSQRPLSFLEAARHRNEYDWWSMYMGSPRPKGGAVFRDIVYFDAAPTRYRVAIGIDFAYTAKTHSDYSVALVLAESSGNYFVLDVVRSQVEAPQFAESLRQLRASYPAAPMFSFIGGTERGVVDFLNRGGLRIHAEPAKQDKFVRAQPVASAWNAKRVALPRGARWLSAFTSELATFTGIGDKHDDQVDALAGAFAALNVPTVRRSLSNLTIA